jgi:hypothetical protein
MTKLFLLLPVLLISACTNYVKSPYEIDCQAPIQIRDIRCIGGA